MSYDCAAGCKRIPFLSTSDPSIQYQGKAVGDKYHDNVRMINEVAHVIANYRRSGHSWITSDSSPESSPSSSPSSKPPIPLHCKWDESLVEIEIQTDSNPVNLAWKLTHNGVVVDKYSNYNDVNTIMTYKSCIKAASCYDFKIYGYNGGGSYKITEVGETILESERFSDAGESYKIAIEGTIKHNINSSKQNKKECKWLKSQRRWRQQRECAKPYIQGVCGRTCETCV